MPTTRAIGPNGSQAGEDIVLSEASTSNTIEGFFQRVSRGDVVGPGSIPAALPYTGKAGQLIVDAAFLQIEDFVLRRTGIVSYGRLIKSIRSHQIEVFRVAKDETVDAWEVSIGDRSVVSVLVTFEDDSGCATAVLRGFGVHITVGDDGIHDLRYNPSEESWMFGEFQYQNGYLNDVPGPLAILRAMSAEAKRAGAQRFEGSKSDRKVAANEFAGQIRMGKGMDPTPGIYAAYAYALAFIEGGASSVHRIMRGNFGVSIYDTALFADLIVKDCERNIPVAPGIPMLRQGWELLRAKNAPVSPAFQRARPFLKESLWMTFLPEGMQILNNAPASEVFELCQL